MTKNYKDCRDKAEYFGKIFVLKNNQPDAVLFSITEYERLSAIIEHLETLNEDEIVKMIDSFPKKGLRRNYSIEHLRNEIEATP